MLCRNVPLTHTGTLVYVKGEHPFPEVDTLEVTRTKEELQSDVTLGSLMGKSVTIEHPSDFVSPDNWQDLTHGTIVNVRPSPEQIDVDGKPEDAILGDLLITTAEAIERVNQGLREVSLGYDAMWELVDKNLAHHKKIIANHVALVENGRAGKDFSIKDTKEIVVLKEIEKKFKTLFGKSLDEAIAEKEKEDKKAKDEFEAKEKADKEKKEKEAGDEGGDKLDRILELLEKLVGMEKEEAGDESEEVEEVVDKEEKEEGESEDAGDDDEDMYKAGDSAQVSGLAEILAPGIEMTKDVKKRALETAYKTKDGKKAIDLLTGGKKLSEVKDEDTLFIAAAELLKKDRTEQFGKGAVAVKSAIDAFPSIKPGGVTAEEINKKNADRYSNK